MAGPKRKAPKAGSKQTPAKAAKKVPLKRRVVVDVIVGQPSKQIEQSFNEGTRDTLAGFRSRIGWS